MLRYYELLESNKSYDNISSECINYLAILDFFWQTSSKQIIKQT